MYPCVPYRLHAGNCARQFAFKAAAVTGILNKLTGAQSAVLFQYFQTDCFIVNQTGGRELHPGFMEITRLDHQNLSYGINFKRDTFALQNFHNILSVVILHTVNKRLVGRLLRPDHDGNADGNDQSNSTDRHDLTGNGKTVKASQKRMTSDILCGRLLRWSHGSGSAALRVVSTSASCCLCRYVFHSSVHHTGMFIISL